MAFCGARAGFFSPSWLLREVVVGAGGLAGSVDLGAALAPTAGMAGAALALTAGVAGAEDWTLTSDKNTCRILMICIRALDKVDNTLLAEATLGKALLVLQLLAREDVSLLLCSRVRKNSSIPIPG
jgi:hypothetical protein